MFWQNLRRGVKMDYFDNRLRCSLESRVIKACKCSPNYYLHNAKDSEEIGAELTTQWTNSSFINLNMFVSQFEVIYAMSQTSPLRR